MSFLHVSNILMQMGRKLKTDISWKSVDTQLKRNIVLTFPFYKKSYPGNFLLSYSLYYPQITKIFYRPFFFLGGQERTSVQHLQSTLNSTANPVTRNQQRINYFPLSKSQRRKEANIKQTEKSFHVHDRNIISSQKNV